MQVSFFGGVGGGGGGGRGGKAAPLDGSRLFYLVSTDVGPWGGGVGGGQVIEGFYCLNRTPMTSCRSRGAEVSSVCLMGWKAVCVCVSGCVCGDGVDHIPSLRLISTYVPTEIFPKMPAIFSARAAVFL